MLQQQPVSPLVPATADTGAGRSIVLPGQRPDGTHILSVLVKRTYDIAPNRRCTRAEMDRRLVAGDKHFGDPMNSSVEAESDFVPFKLATDVVLNGNAYAPDGRPTDKLIASLQIGDHRKDVLVIGDRICRYRDGLPPAFTDPEPFSELDIRYERAYGGVDVYSDRKLACPYARNHLGRGFAVANIKEAIDGLPLPNIEDPSDPLTPERLCCGQCSHWEGQPIPQGFGWVTKGWRPRASFAGVMPADRKLERALRAAYAQAIPQAQQSLFEQTQLPDMDFRFFNGASAGLVLPYLEGDETIRLQHLDPSGDLRFQLPGEAPAIGLNIGEGVQEPEVVLHTVMLRPVDSQVDLVWRGAVPFPGPDWLPEMKKMEVLIR